MRILLSIKAILNYLYNHLIDLVWTKKIKFQDGTEMTTVPIIPKGNNIYDIKILSEAIADKGFAFMCHTVRQNLTKGQVPNVYNDIKTKYDNADIQNSSFATFTGISTGNRCPYGNFGIHNGYIYGIFDKKLKKCALTDINNPIWTTVNNDYEFRPIENGYSFICTDKWIIVCGVYVDKIKLTIVDYDGTILYEKVRGTTNLVPYSCNLSLVKDGNNTHIIYCERVPNDTFDIFRIDIVDNPEPQLITNVNKPCWNFTKHYGKYFFVNNWYTSSGSDNSKLCSCSTNDFINITEYQRCDRTYAIIGDSILTTRTNTNAMISDNRGADGSWSQYNWNFNYQAFTKFNNKEAYISIDPNTKKVSYTEDLHNFTIIGDGTGGQFFVLDENDSYIFNQDGNAVVYYSGISKKVYTDTYNINGSSVNINYYKYKDWKICLADNGTNDANLETVYNYLGYLNYWVLDYVNEFVCIQRDKNTYALMYVGDDFVDNLENLPTNDYSNIVLKKDLEAYINSNLKECITNYALQHLSSKTKDTVYQASEDTLIIIGRTSFTDDFAWELKVSQDNSNWTTILSHAISSGDPGNAVLMYCIIEKDMYYKATGSGISIYNSAPLRA